MHPHTSGAPSDATAVRGTRVFVGRRGSLSLACETFRRVFVKKPLQGRLTAVCLLLSQHQHPFLWASDCAVVRFGKPCHWFRQSFDRLKPAILLPVCTVINRYGTTKACGCYAVLTRSERPASVTGFPVGAYRVRAQRTKPPHFAVLLLRVVASCRACRLRRVMPLAAVCGDFRTLFAILVIHIPKAVIHILIHILGGYRQCPPPAFAGGGQAGGGHWMHNRYI
jgi:hypothetical protein